MKKIKKVEVTPIDRNIGKIVDSTATVDDKTKNTYSMRVIDAKTSDVETQSINVIARGMQNGNINYSSSVNGRIQFVKRGGMVLARFFISPIQTESNICLFNSSGSGYFSIPDKFKAYSIYPATLDNYDYTNPSKIIKAEVITGEMTLNDEVIFDGTYIRLEDFTGQIVSGQPFYFEEITYMAETM